VILDSVVSLAHGLGLLVVAEGLETEEHRAATVEAGADLLQGYLLHRPMPLPALRSVLAQVGTAAIPVVPTPVSTSRTTMARAGAAVGAGSVS
jgi:predicted signal transduction protein with EAL and GGDEF domain